MANIASANKRSKRRPIRGRARARASLAQVSGHAPEALITYRVSLLAQLLSRLVDASVQEAVGLTSRQWRVLVIVNRIGTASSGEVARMAHFDHSQVSRAAYELSDKGLITQVSDASDRRKQMLALTPAGIECLRSGLPGSLQRQARLRSRLTTEEYASFCRALQLLGDEANDLLAEAESSDLPRP